MEKILILLIYIKWKITNKTNKLIEYNIKKIISFMFIKFEKKNI